MTQSRSHSRHLDFDALAHLAATDVARFEKVRSLAIASAIRRAPPACRDRLWRLQWRIDRTRDRAKTPMAACISVYNMMWDSFAGLNRMYQNLSDPTAPGKFIRLPKARVLQYRRRDS